VILPEQGGLRLDKWLAGLEFIPSRSRAAELIDRGLVTKGGKALKASYRLQSGDRIQVEIPPPEPSELQPLDAPLDLLFEDEDLVVLNKPAGLVVHPAAGHAQDTLVNILLHHVGKLSMGFNEGRPGIVHRLDRDTSGVLVVAKNDMAHHHLAAQFKHKTAHRIYWAITHGVPQRSPQTVRSYLARHPTDRKKFASRQDEQGKLAITHFKTLKSLPSKMSWLECRLETGRTHQIRVHLSESGLPILGDRLYGRKDKYINSLNRVALHACELGFEHPRSHEKMLFRVGWPKELAELCDELGFTYVQA
jgi:23S rRNA pseudouridine1911/1915/1917 synthase